jgi:chromosome segregation ATPase
VPQETAKTAIAPQKSPTAPQKSPTAPQKSRRASRRASATTAVPQSSPPAAQKSGRASRSVSATSGAAADEGNKRLVAENVYIGDALKDTNAQYDKLYDRNAELVKSLDERRNELGDAKRRAEELGNALTRTDGALKDMDTQYDKLSKRNDELVKTRDERMKELIASTKKQAGLNVIINGTKEALKYRDAELNRAKGETARIQKDVTEQNVKVSELARQVTAERKKTEGLKSSRRRIAGKLREMGGRIRDMKDNVAAAEASKAEQSAHLAVANGELYEMRGTLSGLEEKNKNLRTLLQNTTENKEKLEASMKLSIEQLGETAGQLRTVTAQHTVLIDANRELNQSFQAAQEENTRVNTELDELNAALDKSVPILAAAQTALAEANTNINSQNEETSRITSALSKARKSNETLDLQRKDQVELSDKQNNWLITAAFEHNNLDEKANSLAAKLVETNNELNAFQNARADIDVKLAAADDELNKSKHALVVINAHRELQSDEIKALRSSVIADNNEKERLRAKLKESAPAIEALRRLNADSNTLIRMIAIMSHVKQHITDSIEHAGPEVSKDTLDELRTDAESVVEIGVTEEIVIDLLKRAHDMVSRHLGSLQTTIAQRDVDIAACDATVINLTKKLYSVRGELQGSQKSTKAAKKALREWKTKTENTRYVKITTMLGDKPIDDIVPWRRGGRPPEVRNGGLDKTEDQALTDFNMRKAPSMSTERPNGSAYDTDPVVQRLQRTIDLRIQFEADFLEIRRELAQEKRKTSKETDRSTAYADMRTAFDYVKGQIHDSVRGLRVEALLSTLDCTGLTTLDCIRKLPTVLTAVIKHFNDRYDADRDTSTAAQYAKVLTDISGLLPNATGLQRGVFETPELVSTSQAATGVFNAVKGELERYKEKLGASTIKAASKAKGFTNRVATFNCELNSLKAKVNRLESNLDSSRATTANLRLAEKGRTRDARDELKACKDSIAKYKAELNACNVNIAKYKAELNACKDSIERHVAAVKRIQAEHSAKLQSLSVEHSTLQASYAVSRSGKADVQSLLDAKADEVASLKESMETADTAARLALFQCNKRVLYANATLTGERNMLQGVMDRLLLSDIGNNDGAPMDVANAVVQKLDETLRENAALKVTDARLQDSKARCEEDVRQIRAANDICSTELRTHNSRTQTALDKQASQAYRAVQAAARKARDAEASQTAALNAQVLRAAALNAQVLRAAQDAAQATLKAQTALNAQAAAAEAACTSRITRGYATHAAVVKEAAVKTEKLRHDAELEVDRLTTLLSQCYNAGFKVIPGVSGRAKRRRGATSAEGAQFSLQAAKFEQEQTARRDAEFARSVQQLQAKNKLSFDFS